MTGEEFRRERVNTLKFKDRDAFHKRDEFLRQELNDFIEVYSKHGRTRLTYEFISDVSESFVRRTIDYFEAVKGVSFRHLKDKIYVVYWDGFNRGDSER